MRRRLPLTLFLLAALTLTTVAVSSATSGPADFTPSPVQLGTVQVGGHSHTTVTVQNTGDTDMAIGSGAFSFSGTNPNAFGTANDGCSGSTVSPNGTCQVDVTFDPATAGSYDAVLEMASDAPTSPDQVAVSGTANQAAIDISPDPFDFGNQKKGTTSGAQQFTISNGGDPGTTLHIANVSIASGSDPAFTIASNGCTDTNAPCTVTVTFAPGATGPLTGTLSVTSSQDGVAPVLAQLSGTGTVPQASVPATVAFATPVNVAKVAPVTLTNTGNAVLNVNGVSLTGDNAFSNTGTGNCGNAALQPGASCQSQIQFKPGSTGAFNATLTFTDDDGSASGSHQQVGLVGTVQVPGIQASPTTVPFGTLVEGRISDATPVTITNTGDANLHIGNVRIGGLNRRSFVLGSENCTDGPVAPHDTCTASVRFAPAKTSGRVAALVFVNDAGQDQSIALTGAGQRPPDGSHLQTAVGCSDAKLSWRNPDAPMFKKVIVVRGRRHYPKGPGDGVVVRHHGTSVLDRGPRPLRTYRYTLFSRYGSYNGERIFYSPGMRAKIHTGRICTPRNGAAIGDLTPTVDWTSYSGARSYAFILQRSGKTIWVHYVRKSRFHIPSDWRYGGAGRSLTHGSAYTFFLYAYTRHKPNGVTIGQTAWTER